MEKAVDLHLAGEEARAESALAALGEAAAEVGTQRLRSERLVRRSLSVGELIGHHRIIKALGRGSMGEVYLCEHVDIPDLRVALKVLAPSVRMPSKWRTRFKNEIAASARVNHRNVIRPYEFIQNGDFLAYTMEYVSGGDLSQWMRKHTTVSTKEVLGILIQVCEGVQAIHDAGIIHRDLKPQNILITENGEVRITDFAVSRTADFERVTLRGQIVGTIDYLSPQYLEHGTVTRDCDIYAVGAVAFEIFTHRAPFIASGIYEAVSLKLANEAPRLRDLNQAVPENLSDVVAKMLRRNPEERYQNAREVADALRTLLADPALPKQIIVDIVASRLATDAAYDGPQELPPANPVVNPEPTVAKPQLVLISGGATTQQLSTHYPVAVIKPDHPFARPIQPLSRTELSFRRIVIGVGFGSGFLAAVLAAATYFAFDDGAPAPPMEAAQSIVAEQLKVASPPATVYVAVEPKGELGSEGEFNGPVTLLRHPLSRLQATLGEVATLTANVEAEERKVATDAWLQFARSLLPSQWVITASVPTSKDSTNVDSLGIGSAPAPVISGPTFIKVAVVPAVGVPSIEEFSASVSATPHRGERKLSKPVRAISKPKPVPQNGVPTSPLAEGSGNQRRATNIAELFADTHEFVGMDHSNNVGHSNTYPKNDSGVDQRGASAAKVSEVVPAPLPATRNNSEVRHPDGRQPQPGKLQPGQAEVGASSGGKVAPAAVGGGRI